MPGIAPTAYLQPNEAVVRIEGRHGRSIVDGILGLVLLEVLLIAGLAFFFTTVYPRGWVPFGVPAIIVLVVLLVWYVIARVIRVRTSRYVITRERVYKSFGRFRFYLAQTTYDRITDLHVHQSFFGRIWNFGTVVVQTAGTGLALDGVRAPFETKRLIEEARTAFIQGLVADARPASASGVARTAPSTGPSPFSGRPPLAEVRWSGGPSLASFVTQILALLVLIPVMLVFSFGSLMLDAGPAPALLGGAMLLFVLLAILGAFIRYKYTRYEINGRGVMVTSGWLSRNRVETTYDKVTDVTLHQGLLARLFNFGNITVNTAGSTTAPVVFQGLSDPNRVKAVIDEAREGARR